jgi:integrase
MSSSESRSASADRPAARDQRRLRKTKTPRVYRRVDGEGKTVGYVAILEVAGTQRKRNARTYDEARRIKCHSETDRDRGELQERTRLRLLAFLDEWIERYQGQGRRGFRENTRDEYRRLIRSYVHPYFSSRLKLVELTPYLLARFVDWLADDQEQGRHLSDSTINNVVNPLRAALATAQREGLIRHNPSQGLALPHRDGPDEDEDEEVKVFSREQLAAVLSMAPERHRLLFNLLAGCGLRISEAIALQRLHFQVDEGPPEVCVRRALVRGRIGPPKSRHGRREVRLSASLAGAVRARLYEDPGRDSSALFFTNEAGGALDPGNLRSRVLKPLVEEVGAPWAGFHAFRHTFASIHLAEKTNLVALSRALGHHSAAFTLSRYTHLLPGDAAPALELPDRHGKPELERCPQDMSVLAIPASAA